MDLRRTVRFLPLIALLGFAFPTQGGEPAVKLKRQGARIDVLIGGLPFTSYYFGADVPKPYLHPLRSARGTIVTRGYPMVLDIPGESTDHPHHRGSYFAHGDINGVDFWAEKQFVPKPKEKAKGVVYTSKEGHRSCALVHLANASYRLSRSLNFDPATEQVIGDDEANQLLRGSYREPFVVPDMVWPSAEEMEARFIAIPPGRAVLQLN